MVPSFSTFQPPSLHFTSLHLGVVHPQQDVVLRLKGWWYTSGYSAKRLGQTSHLTLSRRSKCIWGTFHVSGSLVCHLLPVILLTEMSTTKNVFLWHRFQRDVHLSFEVFSDVHINKRPSKCFLFWSRFSVYRQKLLKDRWYTSGYSISEIHKLVAGTMSNNKHFSLGQTWTCVHVGLALSAYVEVRALCKVPNHPSSQSTDLPTSRPAS